MKTWNSSINQDRDITTSNNKILTEINAHYRIYICKLSRYRASQLVVPFKIMMTKEKDKWENHSHTFKQHFNDSPRIMLSNESILPSSVGIWPPKSLFATRKEQLKKINIENATQSNFPLNHQIYSSKKCYIPRSIASKLSNSPISLGMDAVNILPLKSISSKLSIRPNSDGIIPFKLFSPERIYRKTIMD